MHDHLQNKPWAGVCVKYGLDLLVVVVVIVVIVMLCIGFAVKSSMLCNDKRADE